MLYRPEQTKRRIGPRRVRYERVVTSSRARLYRAHADGVRVGVPLRIAFSSRGVRGVILERSTRLFDGDETSVVLVGVVLDDADASFSGRARRRDVVPAAAVAAPRGCGGGGRRRERGWSTIHSGRRDGRERDRSRIEGTLVFRSKYATHRENRRPGLFDLIRFDSIRLHRTHGTHGTHERVFYIEA